MEMFDKLLSRQKQKREGGGRCWWQVYYATEAAREANNWEMGLSQHFAKWQISAPHQRVSLCHSSRQDELTHLDILHPLLKLCQCSICDKKFRKIYSSLLFCDWWICVTMHDSFIHEPVNTGGENMRRNAQKIQSLPWNSCVSDRYYHEFNYSINYSFTV